jgi:hypothetical protein
MADLSPNTSASAFVMASSAVDALTDLAAALVVSTSQRETEKSTDASTIPIEDDIRAVEEQIDRVSDTANLSTSDRSELDSVGTELWKVCRMHVMEACTDKEEPKTMNGRVLAVAVALLDLASPSDAQGHIRVLQVAFEASRICINTNQLDCSLKILKAAAGPSSGATSSSRSSAGSCS